MVKEWKKIKNYPEYRISNYGEIFSYKSNKILTVNYNQKKNNYATVSLHKNSKTNKFSVARLVLKHFSIKHIPKAVAAHLDLNHKNNKYSNLSYMSRSEFLRYIKTTDKLKGVYYFKITNKWRAVLSTKKTKSVTLGYYTSKKEAASVYYQAFTAAYGYPPFNWSHCE